MAEKHQQELQDAFQKMGENIDKKHVRPLQKAAHLCMAKCFDSSTASTNVVQACSQRCEQPLSEVNSVVQNEINSFQNRMQRCAQTCQDETKDLIPEGAQEGDASVQKAMAHHEKCFGACVKKHLALLPGIEAKIKSAASRVS